MSALVLAPDGVPAVLVRGFKEQAHAESFLSGNVRLQLDQVYRSIEDNERRDTEEGMARLTVPGVGGTDVHYGGSFHNPVYLLCCSDPAAADPKFGRWVVCVNDPGTLLHALGDASSPIAGRTLEEVRLLRVRYSKDSRVADTPDPGERFQLMLAQKPANFAADCEWRYVVMFSGPVPGAPEVIWLKVENMHAIAAAIPPASGVA
jgi:hypothetical protein